MRTPGHLPPPAGDVAQASQQALWGLVCGLFSLIPFIPFGGLLLGTGAVVLGFRGRQEVARGRAGRGMAIAAIVSGSLGLTLWLLPAILP